MMVMKVFLFLLLCACIQYDGHGLVVSSEGLEQDEEVKSVDDSHLVEELGRHDQSSIQEKQGIVIVEAAQEVDDGMQNIVQAEKEGEDGRLTGGDKEEEQGDEGFVEAAVLFMHQKEEEKEDEIVPMPSDEEVANDDEGSYLHEGHLGVLNPEDLRIGVGNEFLCCINMTTPFAGGPITCTKKGGTFLPTSLFKPEINAKQSLHRFSQLSCGPSFCCALETDHGYAICWNPLHNEMALSPSDDVFIQVSVGNGAACGILASNLELKCWELGKGSKEMVHPSHAALENQVAQVSCGQQHCCAILVNSHNVTCWGRNAGKVSLKRELGSKLGFVQVSASKSGTQIAVIESGSNLIRVFGDDSFGQRSNAPVNIAFRSVSAGEHFICGIREDNDELYCWGRLNQLHLDSKGKTFEGVAVGSNVLCGLSKVGGQSLSCFPKTFV